MAQEIENKVERWKLLAENLLSENTPCYIKDINDSYFFADILIVGENTLEVICFAPEKKKNKKFVLDWVLLTEFERYKKKEESNGSNN